jgi:protocatechuate 3,4-dioxygenase beta subunit
MKLYFLLCVSICVSFVTYAQNYSSILEKLDNDLSAGKRTVNEVLSDSSLMFLHSQTTFREIIKKYAHPGSLKIISDNEPGIKITVKGVITDEAGKAVPHALIYVYQTSNLGWYSDTAAHILMHEGDRRHARLFGYFKTNGDGSFELNTIKPHGYPNSDLPAHIHFEVTAADTKSIITELLFDDDPRLAGPVRTRAIQEGFIISKNSGSEQLPVYVYTVKVH